MDYLVKTDTGNLRKLAGLFSEVCKKQGLDIGLAKSTFLLAAFIDEAKRAELCVPADEAAEKDSNKERELLDELRERQRTIGDPRAFLDHIAEKEKK